MHPLGGGGRQCQHLEGVLLGLLHQQGVVAQGLDAASIRGHRMKVQARIGRPQARVQLAQGQKGFGFHPRNVNHQTAFG